MALMDRAAFIQGLPKAELHLHVEGSLEPAMMLDLAGRNGVELPYADIAEARAAYEFSNLQDFLDLYYAGTRVLCASSDFLALADACFRRVGADNVTHLECFVDPQAHLSRGVRFHDLMQGLKEAVRQAAGRGLEVSLILCFLRHLSEREAFRMLEDAAPYHGDFIGVGLDSSELGHPPSKFRHVFAAARELGFRLTAHAGEEGPAEYVWEALDVLGVERIDHGNRALEDDALVARLRRDQVPLTLCPLSNLKLRVVPDLRAHPLKRMLDLGLLVTVNSDDPAYFGGYVNDNFACVAQALDLGETELAAIAANSFKAAFQATGGPADPLPALGRPAAP